MDDQHSSLGRQQAARPLGVTGAGKAKRPTSAALSCLPVKCPPHTAHRTARRSSFARSGRRRTALVVEFLSRVRGCRKKGPLVGRPAAGSRHKSRKAGLRSVPGGTERVCAAGTFRPRPRRRGAGCQRRGQVEIVCDTGSALSPMCSHGHLSVAPGTGLATRQSYFFVAPGRQRLLISSRTCSGSSTGPIILEVT